MQEIRGLFSRFDIYDGLAFGLMACLLFLALAYWNKYPAHMDSFYHMGVTSAYAGAGGMEKIFRDAKQARGIFGPKDLLIQDIFQAAAAG